MSAKHRLDAKLGGNYTTHVEIMRHELKEGYEWMMMMRLALAFLERVTQRLRYPLSN